jgi:hypothetical protein
VFQIVKSDHWEIINSFSYLIKMNGRNICEANNKFLSLFCKQVTTFYIIFLLVYVWFSKCNIRTGSRLLIGIADKANDDNV